MAPNDPRRALWLFVQQLVHPFSHRPSNVWDRRHHHDLGWAYP